MTVTSREFDEDRAQTPQTATIRGNSVSVAETGVILTARDLGNGLRGVAAHGEIDVRSAPALADFACSQIATGSAVVLDLTDVDFFAIAGLEVFERLDAVCAEKATTWVLCSGRPVRRLLQASGREWSVRSYASIDDAIEAVL